TPTFSWLRPKGAAVEYRVAALRENECGWAGSAALCRAVGNIAINRPVFCVPADDLAATAACAPRVLSFLAFKSSGPVLSGVGGDEGDNASGSGGPGWPEACRREETIRKLLGRSEGERLKMGDVEEVALELGVSRATLYRLIRAYRQTPTVEALEPRPRF